MEWEEKNSLLALSRTVVVQPSRKSKLAAQERKPDFFYFSIGYRHNYANILCWLLKLAIMNLILLLYPHYRKQKFNEDTTLSTPSLFFFFLGNFTPTPSFPSNYSFPKSWSYKAKDILDLHLPEGGQARFVITICPVLITWLILPSLSLCFSYNERRELWYKKRYVEYLSVF